MGGCTPDRKSETVASRFVQVSEAHFVYASATAAGYRDNALNRGTPEKEINCVLTKITPDLVLPVIAEALSGKRSSNLCEPLRASVPLR